MRVQFEQFAATVHGTVLRGVHGGNGHGALLLHGTAGSWRNFRPWLPVLEPRCHLVIPDLPGFGESLAPHGATPGLHTWAGLVHELVMRLDVEVRVLIGLGMGASLALAYLRRVKERRLLDRLVLHTPAYYPGAVHTPARLAVKLLTSAPVFPLVKGVLAQRRAREWFVRRFIAASDVSNEDLRELLEDYGRASLHVMRGLAIDMVRADFRPLLHQLATPTLVIVAEGDPFVSAKEVELLRNIMPSARVVVQRHVAHGWTQDAIAQQNALLADFLG